MILFKGCPKCEGDLYVERELGETDLVCLQCGMRRTVRSWADDVQPTTRLRREREREPVGV